ncbi:MAG: AarF/ABC1/UbiB kinase family protein [Nanoarchaeota archaeon]|nr:AarF/ABC1/UbiB kinase family protein [Nanoarchaeota archaeon]MBU1644603.1 AarF/ABC1/UbiB kinase family protein [Nanoarchaeota archaeon]MBU1977011.1 AarF/ABC1/UbiB kinase family protein [Nanoarchaeota archaeon]
MINIADLKRLKEILTVFHEEGLGYYVLKAKLRPYLPFVKRLKKPIVVPVKSMQKQAEGMRRAFERLGPTFIKLGQLLSLRPDLVPKEYSDEFRKLQDRVPAFPFGQAKKMIEQDLGLPLNQVFRNFDKKVLASASVSQVYKAELRSGKKVAVKVQRPNIKEQIDADLEVLFHLAHSLEKHFQGIRNYHPVDIVKEFALWTRKELNFEREALNAVRLREALKDNSQKVKVPKIYAKYSSKRVLTMEFVEGVKMDNLEALKKYRISRKNLVTTYFTSILEQALLHGLFHADPHPANIFVQKDGKLVYLDYGIMGELKPSDRKKIIAFIYSLKEQNSDKSIDIVISLAKDVSKADLLEFKTETKAILEEVYQHSLEEASYAHALYKVISAGARYGVIFDPNHILVAKAIYQAEGLALKLYPQFNVSEGLQMFASEYLQQELLPLKNVKKFAGYLWSRKELLVELPEHITKIITKLESPEPPSGISASQLHEVEHEFEKEMEYMQRRRNLSLIIFTLLLASTILFYLEGRTKFLGLPISGILFVLTLLFLIHFLFFSKKKEVNNNEENGP